MNHNPLALYIHIPFCETKCPYCDFNTYEGIEIMMPSYVNALANEIEKWGKLLNHPPLATVFFGGGTPSFLPTRDLNRLMKTVQKSFDIDENIGVEKIEVTLEANPGDMPRERVRAMRTAGFNRISIGIQSLDNEELRLLGRRHTAEEAKRAVFQARQAGFDNLNIDLIFGLPHQFISNWINTLEQAIELGPNHISLYALTLEPGTPMEADVRIGKLPALDDDTAAEMYLLAQDALKKAGYRQYEISNWAIPGHESIHNLTYWECRPYLGVGPGAHSYLYGANLADLGSFGLRFNTIRSPRQYIHRATSWQTNESFDLRQSIESIDFLDSIDVIDRSKAMGDTMMMGLRLNNGVLDTAFYQRFGLSIGQAFPKATAECMELGLLERTADEYVRLTEQGRLLGNEAFQRFVSPI